jgi:DNA invertase Pin-like site-specific DNA recombinase
MHIDGDRVAISYIRFSTPKQALGDSMRRQLERTQEYCTRHGLTLDQTLTDAGVSALKGRHVKKGELGKFLAAVEAGLVPRGRRFLMDHLDRFSRQNPRIALTYLLNVINAGVRVVTMFNEKEYSDTSETIEHDLIGARYFICPKPTTHPCGKLTLFQRHGQENARGWTRSR